MGICEVHSRKATITMNRPLKTTVCRLRKRRAGKASLFQCAELNVGFKKKILNGRVDSDEVSDRNGEHGIASWRKGHPCHKVSELGHIVFTSSCTREGRVCEG